MIRSDWWVVPHSGRVLLTTIVVLGGITAARLRIDDSSIRRLLLRDTLGCLLGSLFPALVTCSTALIIFMVSGSILLVFDCLLLVSVDLFMILGENASSY